MRVLLFGATGWAGGGVLKGCLADERVLEVRCVVRRPIPVPDKRMRVFEHADFLDYRPLREAFSGVDCCLYCLGVSSMQVNAEEYERISRAFPLAAAAFLKETSPEAAFHWISGAGTSPTNRQRWSQVKSSTEVALMDRFGGVNWRPAAIGGTPSASSPALYRWLRPIFPLIRPFPRLYIDGADLGRAMLEATRLGWRSRIVESAEARKLAAQAASSAPVPGTPERRG